jgi:membrane complex biogenesis BtpA family protein
MTEMKPVASAKKIQFLPPKALIGVLHIHEKPGLPFSRSFINQVTKQLQEEASLLVASGFNALVIENHHNGLTHHGRGSSEMVASMTAIVLAVKAKVSCPLGVQFLDGGNKETLAVAIASDAQFIRVRGFDTIGGAASLLNYRKNIEAETVALFAEIEESTDPKLTNEDFLLNAVNNALSFGADGVIFSSSIQDRPVDRESLRKLHSIHQFPLWVGSGVTSDNIIGLWPFADAFIIDFFLRQEGNLTKQIDEQKLKQLENVVDHLKHSIA